MLIIKCSLLQVQKINFAVRVRKHLFFFFPSFILIWPLHYTEWNQSLRRKMLRHFSPVLEKKISTVKNTNISDVSVLLSVLSSICMSLFALMIYACFGKKLVEFCLFPFFHGGSIGNLNGEGHISEIERYTLLVLPLLCGHGVLYSLSSIALLKKELFSSLFKMKIN